MRMPLPAILFAALTGALPTLAQAGQVTVAPTLTVSAITNANGAAISTTVDLVRAAAGDGWTLGGNGTLILGEDTLSGLQLSFDPDPFINASVTFSDFGASTTLVATFYSPLLLGSNAYDYSLDGLLQVTSPSGSALTIDDVNYGGQDGLFFGLVDGAVVAASGSGPNSGNGSITNDPAAATGSGSCVTCGGFGLGMGLVGAGGGAVHKLTGDWTLTAQTGTGVPEPGTLALLAAGALAAGAARKARPARRT